jgi:indolepyruvate ferredoxin oxidoreductase
MQQQGRAAADNRAAFEWGRWAAHDLAAVEAQLDAAEQGDDGGSTDPFEPSAGAMAVAEALVAGRGLPDGLRGLLLRRVAQAVDYQNRARAERFLGLVERAAAVDDAAHDWALTRAVAESWFRLLTYKDEYEVARLHREADLDHIAREVGIDGPYAVRYHLHPPVLRRLGMRKKLPLGKPYDVAFAALARMKRLRGTAFDVFGWDRDRRLERAVIEEYEQLVDDALTNLPYAEQVALAESALAVKGYGPIKEASIAAWREHVAELTLPVPAGTPG